jgi:arylsulfatase A-like enzyme
MFSKIKACLLFSLTFLNLYSSAANERPNIILIISDDHTYTHYGFMGHEIVQTPHLDRMAAESVLYTRGYSMPVCSPSLASLLTGTFPRTHGITGNDLHPDSPQYVADRKDRSALRERLLANPLILPAALTTSGYLTFQTGKIWNASYKDMGFTHGMTAERDRHGGAGLTIGRDGMEPIFDFIETAVAEEKPFFIWHAPLLPHDPHNPPGEILAKYRGKGPTRHAEVYYAMVEWLDNTCAELDDWLADKGLMENTVILYLADNGWDPNLGYRGGRAKLTPYENGIRTPMFVRWPGKIAPLRDDETLASIVDFPSTILQLAGIDVPEALPGLNLIDHAAMQARKTVFVESYSHDIMDLDHPKKSLTSRVVIDGWSKLIIPAEHRETDSRRAKFSKIAGEIELFDLKNDPTETTNLAAQRPDEVARLQALQDAVWKIE